MILETLSDVELNKVERQLILAEKLRADRVELDTRVLRLLLDTAKQEGTAAAARITELENDLDIR